MRQQRRDLFSRAMPPKSRDLVFLSSARRMPKEDLSKIEKLKSELRAAVEQSNPIPG